MITSVEVIYPTENIDDVSVNLPKGVSNSFFFSGFRSIGRAPVP
jgi:hypothetical protein